MKSTNQVCSLVFLIMVLFPTILFSAVIYVPTDYPTIQQAINAASIGDEIIVLPGTYYENINFGGKDIILRSTDPTSPTVVASTIINGNQSGSVVTFAGTESANCILAGFTITNGKATYGGGINANEAFPTIQYNLITQNKATPSGRGGGIALCNGIIHNNVISNNSAAWGGGLYYCNYIIHNNTITANSGGGLYICGGIIQYNIITDNSGGGISNCRGTIQYNTISGNRADNGGGISRSNGLIQNNIISNNSAESVGGGLFECDGTIQNNIICQNSATSMSGGGIMSCDGVIKNNIICHNLAQSGGGICGGSGIIQNNIIYQNSAYLSGGGILGSNGTIQNNIIYQNAAGVGAGLCNCDGIIQNNTIWHNIANSAGGGISDSDGTIRNCIIWDNIAPIGAQIFNSVTPSYSCIPNWVGFGQGNISLNPQLADPENGDFHLLATSPCIDAGCFVGDLLTDFEGDPRGYDGTSEPRGDGSDYDIGADEFVAILPTPTPTPEPTLTPSPTPTPALPHFIFEEGEEGWTFAGDIPPFDEAAGNWEGGHLTLNALGSTNCFGYWFSPDVAVEDGKLYRACWTVGSDATDPDKTVGFRLRINQRGSWAGWDRVVNSYLGQAPSAGNPKTYYLYFDPLVTGINDDYLVIFSFDLTSFDTSDDANSSLYLEELVVEDMTSFLITK